MKKIKDYTENYLRNIEKQIGFRPTIAQIQSYLEQYAKANNSKLNWSQDISDTLMLSVKLNTPIGNYQNIGPKCCGINRNETMCNMFEHLLTYNYIAIVDKQLVVKIKI